MRVWVVTRAGEEVRLTATEWRLLELLIGSEGRLLTYETLSSDLRGGSSDLDAKALRVRTWAISAASWETTPPTRR